MQSLIRRLHRLEVHHAIPLGCSECGRLPDGSRRVGAPANFEVSFGDSPDEPEFCTTCGGRRVFIIEFDKGG